MLSDDLTGLFAPKPDAAPFRQAQVVSYNKANGNNTINLAGTLLTNLPLLNQGDAINLIPGDVVVLLRIGSSWAILGRVVLPGAGALNSSAIDFGGSNPAGTGFSLSTSSVSKASGTIAVPAWANRASCICTVAASVRNPTAASDFMYASAQIAGSGGAEMFAQVGAGGWGFVAAHATRNDMTVTPGGSFTVGANMKAGTAWSSTAQNLVQVDSYAIFTKK